MTEETASLLSRLEDEYSRPGSKLAILDELTTRFDEGAIEEADVREVAEKILASPKSELNVLGLILSVRLDPDIHATAIQEQLSHALTNGSPGPMLDVLARELVHAHDEMLQQSVRTDAESAARSGDRLRVGIAIEVLAALALAGDGTAVRPLAPLLDDPAEDIATAAAAALGRCSRMEAFSALERVIAAGKGPLYEAAFDGLFHADQPDVIDALAEAFDRVGATGAKNARKLRALPPRFRKRRRDDENLTR